MTTPAKSTKAARSTAKKSTTATGRVKRTTAATKKTASTPQKAVKRTPTPDRPRRTVKRTAPPTEAQRQQADRAGRQGDAMSVEQLLISSIITHGEMHVAVTSGVMPSMFVGFHDEYSYLSRSYTKHRKTPSAITFRTRFPDFAIVTTADDTAHLSEELRRLDAQGVMVSTMRDALDKLRNGDLEEATKHIGAALRAASSTVTVYERDVDMLDDYDEMLADVKAIRDRAIENGGMAGVPWGFPVYDSRTGGAKPGELIVVAARLGEGKSAVLSKWGANAVQHNYRVQFDALEMSRTQMGMRLHSLLSAQMGKVKFNSEDLMLGRGNVDLDEYRAFLDLLKRQVKGKLFVSDNKRGRTTVQTIERQIERNNPDIVFVDYIQLVGKKSNDWQGLGEVSGELKVLAQEASIPIVVASQLNRANGLGKDPAGAEAISGADAIGHDADQIITMKQNTTSTLTMQSVKNRHGRSGMKWYVDFRPGDGVINECGRDRWEALRDKDAQQADDGEVA